MVMGLHLEPRISSVNLPQTGKAVKRNKKLVKDIQIQNLKG